MSRNPDVFISHASEDKIYFVEPLAKRLRGLGYEVWYDRFSLIIGDDLKGTIYQGISLANYGIVVFSPDFIRKCNNLGWPWTELIALWKQKKNILPIFHRKDEKYILNHANSEGKKIINNIIKNTLYVSTDIGLKSIVAQITRKLGYLPWSKEERNYKQGDIVNYNGRFFRCIQSHTNYGDPNWNPINVPALWKEINN